MKRELGLLDFPNLRCKVPDFPKSCLKVNPKLQSDLDILDFPKLIWK